MTSTRTAIERLRLWGWLPHALVGLLAIPFIIGQNSWYEWGNSLWLLDLQTAHVSAYGIPTFFIDAAGEYFYPQQLFYAGPGVSVLAYPALLFGTWPVFAATCACAFSAASAGVSWAARNLGVPPRPAIVPGVLFAMTPYTVSNLYGRGAWAELVAVAGVSVALGAATSLLSGRARSRPGAMAVMALAVAEIAGMHNLTLLFSALLAPLLGIALLPLLRGTPTELLGRFALTLAGAVTGLALVGAFLVPNVWLSGRTYTGRYSYLFLSTLNGFDHLGIVLNPLPIQPAGIAPTDLHTQTLGAALLWLLVAAPVAVTRRWLDRRTLIALALLALGAVALALLIDKPIWWTHLPATLGAIQFPFRLVSYLSLLIVLAVAVLLAVPALHRNRSLITLLLIATAWQAGIAAYLAIDAKARGTRIAPTPANVRADVVPPAFAPGQRIEFRLVPSDPIPTPAQRANVAPVGDDSPAHVHLSGRQPAGTLVSTTVVASPLIRITGDASVAGANADGFEMLRVDRTPWRATVSSACNTCVSALTGAEPFALLAGRVLSVVGLLVLVGLIGVPMLRRRRMAR